MTKAEELELTFLPEELEAVMEKHCGKLWNNSGCPVRLILRDLMRETLEWAAERADNAERDYLEQTDLHLRAGATVQECNRYGAKVQLARELAARIRAGKSEAK